MGWGPSFWRKWEAPWPEGLQERLIGKPVTRPFQLLNQQEWEDFWLAIALPPMGRKTRLPPFCQLNRQGGSLYAGGGQKLARLTRLATEEGECWHLVQALEPNGPMLGKLMCPKDRLPLRKLLLAHLPAISWERTLDSPADLSLFLLFRDSLKVYLQLLEQNTTYKEHEDWVHRLRVEGRRLREIPRLCNKPVDLPGLRWVKAVHRACSQLRSLDTLVLREPELLAHPALMEERQSCWRDLMEACAVAGPELRHLLQDLPQRWVTAIPYRRRKLRRLARSLLRQGQRMRARWQRLGKKHPVQAFHAMRITFKGLRYRLEHLTSMGLPGEGALSVLRRVQDGFGALQDEVDRQDLWRRLAMPRSHKVKKARSLQRIVDHILEERAELGRPLEAELEKCWQAVR
jgi:CHAD domain-containing protein